MEQIASENQINKIQNMPQAHNLKSEFINIHNKYFQAKGVCFYKNCKNVAIKSHTISKSELNKIAFEGKVYEIKLDIYSDSVFKKTGVNKMSTFYGFCKTHDNLLFEKIDKFFDFTKDNIQEIAFLSLYRIICKEIYLNGAAINENKEISQNILLSPKFNSSYLSQRSSGLELEKKDLEKLYNKLSTPLIRKKWNVVNYKIFTFDNPNLPYAFSTCYVPEKNKETGEIFQDLKKYKIVSLTSMFSFHSKSKAYIILAWHKTDDKVCKKFVVMLSKKRMNELPKYISSIAENFAINTIHYEGLSEKEKIVLRNNFLEDLR